MIKYFISGVVVLMLVFAGIILIPRNYDSPKIQKRSSTKYWDLPTGSRIAYSLIKGKPPKKQYPIIYLHGGPGGPIYDRNIKNLAPLSEDGYDVYLYDQIGGGHSERLEEIEEYTTERHKADLNEIINKIGVEKVILIGQSWGAILANMFNAAYPEKVNKIIFTSPGPIVPIRSDLANIIPPDSLNLKEPFYSNRQGNIKANNLRTRLMSKYAVLFGKKLTSDNEADDFATFLNFELNKSTLSDTSILIQPEGGAGFYVQIMTLRSFDRVEDQRAIIQQLNTPILVMKGQYDNQKWGFTKEYLDLYSNHELVVIPNVGHSIAIEQPDLYLETIRRFLNL